MTDNSYNYCKVCLDTKTALFNVVECDINNVDYLTKLEFTVPEILWNHNNLICDSCVSQLNTTYCFKKLCLKSYKSLQPCEGQKIEEKFDGFEELDDNINPESDTDETVEEKPAVNQETLSEEVAVFPIFNCRNCDEKIVDRKLLIKHNKLVHKSETPYDCSQCNSSYKSNKELTNHERVHLNKKTAVKCKECDKTFMSENTLNNHLVLKHTASENWKHKCSHCENVFPTVNYLENHIKKTHIQGKLLVTCFHCKLSFKDKNILLKHLQMKHHNNSENESDKANQVTSTRKRPCRHFSCEICGKILNSSRKLIKHCVTDHKVDAKSVKPFACDQCEKKFSTSTILIEHKRYHARNRSNICSFCGKGFITKNDLNCHESIHFNERSFKCEVCFKGFNTQKNLRTHRIVKHGDPMSWKHCCNVCNKRFAMLSNFKVHVRRHMGDKQFACHLCDKKFVNKDELRQHLDSHSIVREFKCFYCEREYKKKRTYHVHLKKVHGIGDATIPKREKKHMCHLCPKTYFDKSKLTKHLMTHSGIKPFGCNVCEKKFTDNYYLKLHIRNVHEEQVAIIPTF